MLYVNVPRSTKISASRNNLKREPSKDSTQSECAQEYYQDARGGTLCEEHGRARDQASLQTVQKKIILS